MTNLNKAYATPDGLQGIMPLPIEAAGSPSSSNVKFPLGQIWLNTTAGTSYILAKKAAGAATWNLMSPGASDVDTITGDSGGALSPAAGNITLAGGTNVTSVGAGSTVTFNLDAAITLATSVTSPIYTAPAATDMAVTSVAGQDINVTLGDASGANKISFADSGASEVASLDSNGNLTVVSAISPTYTAPAATDLAVNAIAGQDILVTLGDAGGANKISFMDSGSVEMSSVDSDGRMRAAFFDTNVAAAGLTVSATDIDADGTDANISITATPKGTGTFTVDSGGIVNSAGDIINTHSDAGTDVTIEVTNSDNTNLASRAGFEAAVGGTSGGDPYVNFLINGGQTFTMGIDNSSTNDDFVISDSAALGTTNRISIDGSTGDTSVLNNLALPTAATQLQVEGGAVTDFIGQATLSSGTVTVANTNIAAGDRIICTRSSINGSSALGILITAINAGSDFTITAVQPGTPASAETNDVSIVDYFIVRQL